MIARIARAGLLWPTLLSLVGLVILFGLGTWQLYRKAEKEALIAVVEARLHGEPLELAEVISTRKAAETDYQRVKVSGEFVPGKERFYYAPQPKLGPGYDVYQPLQYAPGKVVWVNRGFIFRRVKDKPEVWQAGQGGIEVTGNARLPAKPGFFTPDNDAKSNTWYWRDLAGMQGSAFEAGAGVDAAPVFIVAEPAQRSSRKDNAALDGASWPRPGVSDIAILNRHLEYALTWFGLALTLLGVYVAYAWSRLRP